MTREEIISVVSSIIVFFILTFLQIRINSKRIKRSLQIALPISSVIYSVSALVYLYVKYRDIIDIIGEVANRDRGNGLVRVIGLNSLALDVFVINAGLYLIYVFGRFIPQILIIAHVIKKPYLTDLLSLFYVYDEKNGEWLLKDEYTNLRELFKVLSYAASLLTGLMCGLIWIMGTQSIIHVYVFPALVTLIITEIYNFLNGITEIEYGRTISGDDSYAQKVRNFYKIREIFEEIFSHEILTSETGCDFREKKSVVDLIEELAASESETERKIAEFYKLNGNPESYDADYISASMQLLKGENVVFFNPFYRDLDKYLTLPLLYNLLSNRNCLVITGRESVKEDVAVWIRTMLSDYGKMESLWRVRELDFHDPECEIGIIGSSRLYDSKVMLTNEEFLREVGIVIIIEASRIVNTGQIGLSILGHIMNSYNEQPVYCFLDRITDGLVDSLSHIFQINITNVVAPPISRNIRTSIAFDADGDYLREKLFEKQTGYLADGIELAAVAIKNQIPEVNWYSDTKTPIRDIKWLAGQYFATICKYMNVPIQQESLYDHIGFISNIWSLPTTDYQFIVAEDEFRNVFNTMRMFLSRGREQTFVNVLTENYLLRDYMRCNPQMFMSNPDAIPSIVPDYAKTERNVLIKLLYEMSLNEISENEIKREFALVGLVSNDALSVLTELLKKYFNEDNTILTIRVEKYDMSDAGLDEENMYSILRETFDTKFCKNLKQAFFICENEGKNEYIDAKLFGHITQMVLPGQFIVFDGKYYIVYDLTVENGVILRRASNLYEGRKYYRQIREYEITGFDRRNTLSCRTTMDIEFTKLFINFNVSTKGYLEMNSNCDLRTARVVDLRQDPHIEDYNRSYRNKTALLIRLPDADEDIRYTICMLLSELFKTVFPDAWEYLAVTTAMSNRVNGMLNYLVYELAGVTEDDSIYILEDSEIDLGLLEAVEKNMTHLLEIITDYLGWHFEKMREGAHMDPEPVTPEFPAFDYKKRKKTIDLFKRIRALFGVKKEEALDLTAQDRKQTQPVGEVDTGDEKKEGNVIEGAEETAADEYDDSDGYTEDGFTLDDTQTGNEKSVDDMGAEDENMISAEPEQKTAGKEPVKEDDPDADPELVAVDGTDIFDESGSPEDDEYLENCFVDMGLVSPEESRYQKECYLKFGFDYIDDRLRIDDVHKYLTVRGFANNSFKKARKRDIFEETLIDLAAVNHCDFCGIPISGVSYERITDGRIRCNDCSMTAIRSVEEFGKLFNQTLSLMMSFFDIDYNVRMSIKVVDAKEIAKGYGSLYSPSTEYTDRILGYARRNGNGYDIYIENGSPRLAAISTITHELTHIWQFHNWDEREIEKEYVDPEKKDIVYEGMAEWVSIQYLYLIGENSYAQKQELMENSREDVYGYGFKMYCSLYPLIKNSSLIKYSPFTQFPPL